MFAPGATACAHWTSSDVSADQPTWLSSFGSNGWVARHIDDVERGRRQTERAVEQVEVALGIGLPYASMITIVRPLPFTPLMRNDLMPYARWI